MFDKMFLTLQILRGDFIARLERDEEGATMVEYGLMVAAIALVVFAAAQTLGGRIVALFNGFVF